MTDLSDVQNYSPERAMVVVAHPDDAEFMVAGTVAKWVKHGCIVSYVVITNGNKGTEDRTITSSQLAEIREAEQREAGSILGVKNFDFLGYEDGYLVHTLELRRDITRLIRKYQPEVVFCFDPTARFLWGTYTNHPDHRASGDATVDAIFPSARDHLTFPELLEEGFDTHKVKQLWMGSTEKPNVWVDISETLEAKKDALLAHPSQIGPEVVNFIGVMSAMQASEQSFEHAESFRRIIFDQPRTATPGG